MSKKSVQKTGPIRPYGDTTGDGMVQLSFTLPIPHSKVAEGAAAQLANKMGMDPALVVHAKPMGPDFTFFVVYGRVHHLVDTDQVQVVERDYPNVDIRWVPFFLDPTGGGMPVMTIGAALLALIYGVAALVHESGLGEFDVGKALYALATAGFDRVPRGQAHADEATHGQAHVVDGSGVEPFDAEGQ